MNRGTGDPCGLDDLDYTWRVGRRGGTLSAQRENYGLGPGLEVLGSLNKPP